MYWNPTPSCHGSRSGGSNDAGAAGAASAAEVLASNAAVESCADAVSARQSSAMHRIDNLRIRMTLLTSQGAFVPNSYSTVPVKRVHSYSPTRFPASQHSAHSAID